jgi:hypothetical protein
VFLRGREGSHGLDLSFLTHVSRYTNTQPTAPSPTDDLESPACQVFLMEEIWDKSLEYQVVSRAYRMGAQASVRVEKMIMTGTVEELMHEINSRISESSLTDGGAEAEDLPPSESPAIDLDADDSGPPRSDSLSSVISEGSATSASSGSSSSNGSISEESTSASSSSSSGSAAAASSPEGTPKPPRRKSKGKSKATTTKRSSSAQITYEQAKVRWLLSSLDLVDMPEPPPCSFPPLEPAASSSSASVSSAMETDMPELLPCSSSTDSVTVSSSASVSSSAWRPGRWRPP